MVEKRERRLLYQLALDGPDQSEEGATTMRLENEIEQAQRQRLEVSAVTGATQQEVRHARSMYQIDHDLDHKNPSYRSYIGMSAFTGAAQPEVRRDRCPAWYYFTFVLTHQSVDAVL